MMRVAVLLGAAVLFGLAPCGTGLLFGPFESKPYLTPTGTPWSSVNIGWNTATLESTRVAYGLTSALGDTIRLEGVRNYHHARITGLLPDCEYYYRVLPAGNLNRFRTFPARSDTGVFIVVGDTRTDSAAHQSVVNEIAGYDHDFIINCGDLVEDGNLDSLWQMFFSIEDTLLETTHFLPVLGNHEAPYWQYDTLFSLPDSEEYYSVDCGNIHVVALNTETNLVGPQLSWLRQDLERNRNNDRTDWTIVAFHRPPYSSGSHGSQLDVREAWCHLFETYQVDLVFAGHDHDYERTVPINGVVYVISGGGGAPLRGVGTNPWTAYAESTYQFCQVEIKNRYLRMRAVKPNGTVFDSLIIDKGRFEPKGTTGLPNRRLSVIPNPMHDQVVISCQLDQPRRLRLSIADHAGREVTILKDTDEPAGLYLLIWDGRDRRGKSVGAGVYFVVAQVGGEVWMNKITRVSGD